ncbi:MAG: hypothetical protein PHH20_01295 [Candidatus Omnitrophica bacterium]|nr:hypothetical protein [Candidatus Omnitrophota bacterium]
MARLMTALLAAVFIMASAVAFADTVFSDDFSTNTVGTNWTAYTSNVSCSATISGGTANFHVNYNGGNGFANFTSIPFNASGDVDFSGELMLYSPGVATAATYLYLHNSVDPTKYFRVEYDSYNSVVRFYDSSTTLLGSVANHATPSSLTDFSLTFNGVGWQYYENNNLLKEFASSTMAGVGSFYLKIGGWDASSTNCSAMFDNIAVNATAVPEPVSTTLFILGGATMAVRRIRKGGKG